MKVCPNCGVLIEENSQFCPECGTKLTISENTEPIEIINMHHEEAEEPEVPEVPEETVPKGPERKGVNLSQTMSGITSSAKGLFDSFTESSGKAISNAKESYNRSVAEAAENHIVLADGEVVIREYEATKVRFPRAVGKLIVTNKRIMFYSGSLKSKIMSSVPIESAGSISMFNGYALNFIAIAVTLVMLYLFITLSQSRFTIPYAILCLLIAVVSVYFAYRRAMFLSIASVNSSTGLMIGRSNILGASIYSVDGYAGKDAEAIMNEIGAIVLDLKQNGDLAVEKWKQ